MVRPLWNHYETLAAQNQERVLKAFLAQGLTTPDLQGSTGYGYGDRGRERLDQIFAQALGACSALVRAQWVSGTHALATVLHALLLPGDELWIASGPVYDTLRPLIQDPHHPAGLMRRGITVRFVEPDRDWPQTTPRVVYIQRSCGYQARTSWGEVEIRPIAQKAHQRGAWVIVDNCYGEFTATAEPTQWGADLIVGSLMKNPGGGIATTGAYVAGQTALVERIADMLFAPGLGSEVGPTRGFLREFAQGLFMAPTVVAEALMGGAYLRALCRQRGLVVQPQDDWCPNDIVTAIRLGSAERVRKFCAAIQAASPIDSRAQPEPWEMPGYSDPVIMAAGGFVAGGSLELSCDAPMREPYWVYLQGGLTRWHTVMAGEQALTASVGSHDSNDAT